jgi:hypothetical protein
MSYCGSASWLDYREAATVRWARECGRTSDEVEMK